MCDSLLNSILSANNKLRDAKVKITTKLKKKKKTKLLNTASHICIQAMFYASMFRIHGYMLKRVQISIEKKNEINGETIHS